MEHVIGETFTYNGHTLRVESSDGFCGGCFFQYKNFCTRTYQQSESDELKCTGFRKDKQPVIFREVKMTNYKEYLNKANALEVEADGFLNKALNNVLKSKEIPEYIIVDFGVCFASGGENVVHYKGMTRPKGLDIEHLASMDKEQIMKMLDEFAD